MKKIIDVIEDRLNYKNLSQNEKINYIKNLYNLEHGKGKRKKKKGGKK